MAADRAPLWHLGVMGAVAGLPTILGTWIGGFSYSPIATTLFLGLGLLVMYGTALFVVA